MITLHELIEGYIIAQRFDLMRVVATHYTKWLDQDECVKHLERIVFSEQDILEIQISSLGLTVNDINPSNFRDMQHQSIATGVEHYNTMILTSQ